jgi:hypothetical protein
VHFKQICKFMCDKDLCVCSAGHHTPYYPSIFIFWEWSKVYNKIFSALSIHVKYNSITYCTREEGGIPKNTKGWIVNHGLNHHH